MGKIKRIRSKVYAFFAPKWCTKVLVTKKEILEALEFWDEFEIPMHPTLAKMRRIISHKKYGELTLKHQKVIVRCILADIASKTHLAFKDTMFNEIATECAEVLVQANKADTIRGEIYE